MEQFPPASLAKGPAMLLILAAAGCFYAAYSIGFSFLILGYAVCLVQLARLQSTRTAFYAGLVTGFLCFAPQLEFFWSIFGMPAITLWTILALWIALFVALTHLSLMHLGAKRTALLTPFLWTGLEYFRSELYYLRFSWLNVGYALGGSQLPVPFREIGVYGIGFIVVLLAAWTLAAKPRWLISGWALVFGLLALVGQWPMSGQKSVSTELRVAGVQMEAPSEKDVIANLDKLSAQFPNAQLLVLSEYTFDGPIPNKVKQWCRNKRMYLVAGGKDIMPNNRYYDTAFVVGPDGDVVFKQAKSVPIQLFDDGLPAKEQRIWNSPWGRIGICICYDLSYSRVTDRLIRLGAQAFVVPTMDVAEWGRHEHELHQRVALVRAAEYGIPIFRMASSGISQLVASNGQEKATAPFGVSDAFISGGLAMTDNVARLPADRILAPFSVVTTGCFIVWILLVNLRNICARFSSGNKSLAA